MDEAPGSMKGTRDCSCTSRCLGTDTWCVAACWSQKVRRQEPNPAGRQGSRDPHPSSSRRNHGDRAPEVLFGMQELQEVPILHGQSMKILTFLEANIFRFSLFS
jgi:hypothetical protein